MPIKLRDVDSPLSPSRCWRPFPITRSEALLWTHPMRDATDGAERESCQPCKPTDKVGNERPLQAVEVGSGFDEMSCPNRCGGRAEAGNPQPKVLNRKSVNVPNQLRSLSIISQHRVGGDELVVDCYRSTPNSI